MNAKTHHEMKESEKALAMGVYSEWNDQTNRYFSELLSRYPIKKMSLKDARELQDSRLGDRELSEIVREMRDE